jgi:hypothetical protein
MFASSMRIIAMIRRIRRQYVSRSREGYLGSTAFY